MAGCGRCRPRRRAAGNQPRRAPPDQLLPSQGTTNQSAPSTPWIYPKLERVPEPNSPPRCARRQHCPWAARGPAASSVAAAAAAAAPAPPRTPAPRDPAVDGPRDRHPRRRVVPARGGGGGGPAEGGPERGGGGALLGLDVVLLADGLVGHGGRAASPLLAVGRLHRSSSGTAAAAAASIPVPHRGVTPAAERRGGGGGFLGFGEIARGGEGGGGERKPGRGKSVGGRRVIE